MNDPTSPARSAVYRSLFLAACVVLCAGCEDPNKMFEGVWTTTQPPHEALEGHFVGKPTLAIVHYGLDLTGLVYFQSGAGEYRQTCPCALVEQDIGDTIDFDGRQISFITSCLQTVDPDDGSANFSNLSLRWHLTMGDEPDLDERTLSGEVRLGDASEPVHFERIRRDVPDERKQCPPAQGWCDPNTGCEGTE